jgi:hypothetical protein
MSQTHSRILDLALACLATQLPDNLDDLGYTGAAEGMAFAEQSPAGVDRQPSVDVGFAALDCRRVFTLLEQSKTFHPKYLSDAEAVVDFGEVDLVGTNSRPLISILGGRPGERFERHGSGLDVDRSGP